MHFLSGENGIVYNYTAGDLFLTVHDPDNLDYCNDVSLSISDLVKANIMVEEQCRKAPEICSRSSFRSHIPVFQRPM